MLGREFHIRNFAASLGQAFKTTCSVSTMRGRFDFTAVVPDRLFNLIWVGPISALTNYLDLWDWDACDS
jgi:hypothetical protein